MDRHILMLLSNAYTRDGRVRREVRSLVAAGWRVTVIAWDRAADHPAEERLDGARIVRVRSTSWMRLRRYDILRLGAWNRLAAKVARALHKDDPFTRVHAHDLDTLGAGLALKRSFGVPLVYDAHEIWGYMIAKDLPRPVVDHFLRKERRLVRHVDHVLTVSPPIREHLARHTSAPIDLVMNAKPTQVDEYVPPEGDTFRTIYVGILNPTRKILELIEALGGVKGIELTVAGLGPAAYVARVEAAAALHGNVSFIGPVANETVLGRTLASDLVACLFDPHDPLTRIGMPNKVFEAMATGRPTLATSGTYLGRFVEEHEVGLASAPVPEAIRDAVCRLRDDPARQSMLGRNALARAQGEYGWPAQETRLLAAHEHPGVPAGSR